MKFVAITSCPTGIAHSQMAAENIEQTATEQGHDIAVEVQGAMGAENELSQSDIDEADAVIVAADTSVSTDRFDGLPVVEGPVKDGVNDAEGLIERAVAAANGEDADTTETAAATETSPDDAGGDDVQRRRGGDRSKSLVARLKRLLG